MFDAVADVDFFPLLGEGAQILKRLDEDSDSFFADLSRLREILALVGDGEGQDEGIFYSLASPEASIESIRKYADGAMQRLPAHATPFEYLNAVDLAAEVGAVLQPMKWLGMPSDQHYIGTADSYIAKGHKIDFDPQEVLSLDAEVERIRSENIRAEYDSLYTEKRMALFATEDRLVTEIEKLRKGLPSKASEVEDEFNKQIADFKKFESEYWNALVADWQRRQQEVIARAAPHGERIIQAMKAASPVNDADAKQWASLQEIDKSAVTKLKKSNYPAEQVKADMAEFYQLVGGKCPAIVINTTGRRRASAGGITSRSDEKVINIGTGFNKRVLWHEMGHHLEFDELCKAAANGFLLKRRESEKLFTLRSLTGINAYRPDEVAYRDSFINPYVGKYYRSKTTEVFSMGLENFSDPISAARFAAKDPEHFALITGYVSSPLSPAQAAKIGMHKQGNDQKKQQNKSLEDEYADLISKMASRVNITADGWYDGITDEDRDRFNRIILGYRALSPYQGEHNQRPDYIGSYAGLRVFSGTFENLATRRASKGYRVYLCPQVSPSIIEYEYMATIHGDMETLKAFLFAAGVRYEKDGISGIDYLAIDRFRQRKPIQPMFYENFIRMAKGVLGLEG